MQNFVMILVAMSPLTVASPYGASPRDTSCCTSASSGAFSWTIEAFDYHSSETFTTPAHEVASGYVDFKLNNPALPEEVHCAATSSVVTNYFYGDVNYACNAPAGSQTKTSFTFNALNKGLSINQTWTCSDGNPQDSYVSFSV
jgi:hypothetical protein